jgi:hypothetical protein
MSTKYKTQMTDTFIDNHSHAPVEHETEESARRYAIDLTNRRRCEVTVHDPAGFIIDTYEGGAVAAGVSA